MKLSTTVFSVMFAGMGLAGAANASTFLDFTTLPQGAVASNTYAAEGVTINAGDTLAQAEIGVIPGLSNSIYGYTEDVSFNYPYYPTHSDTTFDFSNGVSDVSFYFNNYGDNGRSAYYAYGASGLISDLNIAGVQGGIVDVTGAGITKLVVSNNGNDWVYGISNLSFTAVPEPSTWAMMLAGFAGLGFAGYRGSRKSVALVA